MRIDSNNWRAEAPELYKFDLTDPTARLVAADYAQDRGDEALADWLRALPAIEPLDPERAAYTAQLVERPVEQFEGVFVEAPPDGWFLTHAGGTAPPSQYVLAVYRSPHKDGWLWCARVGPPQYGVGNPPRATVHSARDPYEALLGLVLFVRAAYRRHRGPDDPAAQWAGAVAAEVPVRPVGGERPAWWRGAF